MRCLVTGAAGFIGSSLTDALLAAGHEVRGVDCFVDYYPRPVKESNLKDARKNRKFEFLELDLTDTNLKKLLEDVDVVYHLAAQAGVRASWGGSFDSYTRNNVLATQMLLEACRGLREIQKVVFASSSSVYGNAETLPTREDALPQPVSPYGVTKLAAEHLMSLYASEFGVPTVSLRYFTVFGPRQRPEMAFHRFIRAGLQGEKIVVYGDGEQSRDFTFIGDILRANMLAAEKGEPGGVYNIGGGCRATINEVLKIIENSVGKLNVERVERQAGDARHTSADTGRAREQLGFVPQVSLVDGLQAEINWLRG